MSGIKRPSLQHKIMVIIVDWTLIVLPVLAVVVVGVVVVLAPTI